MKKAIFIFSGALAIAAVVFGTMVAVAPQRALATPAYAQQTGRPCASCHVNKAGGGKLTAAGAKFAKTHR